MRRRYGNCWYCEQRNSTIIRYSKCGEMLPSVYSETSTGYSATKRENTVILSKFLTQKHTREKNEFEGKYKMGRIKNGILHGWALPTAKEAGIFC